MGLIGIDLGTTFCAVAALDDRGRPVSVPNRDGDILTPSAVYLAGDGSAVVGQPALDLALEEPERVATLVKRRMGLPDYGRPVAGREFRPETLSAVILKKLAQDAAAHLGPVTGCVITVPAYFDDTRRKATMDAGRIAGLNVLDIIDEPSAAALAYSVGAGGAAAPAPQTVLVYDLGGGTFDVTLVKLGKKRFQVLGIEGDVRLGGRDWDDRIAAHAAERFAKEFGTDPRTDPQSDAALQASAERAKRSLSKVEQVSVTVSHDGRRLTVPITRAEFETMTRDLLVRTRLTAQHLLASTGLTWDQVDKVLMVGGSTHMPATRKMLADLTGREPDHSLAVSEVVARGAAVHAGIRSAADPGNAEPPPGDLGDIVEISVNAHSLGVQVRQGDEQLNHKLVPKNTQLPAAAEQVYYTAADDQTRVRVRILQGEANQAEACIPVGECWIEGLPPDLPKGSPVKVRCGVGSNGRIEVTATDLTSGRAATAAILRPGGLTDQELAREAAWVRNMRVQ
ncbi:Heat shock protein 70 OS=Planctomyces limnophilus (strain ATCC 43296 / DSM 3776 / IFAM 1008 / 290) GN=Plim_3585 PE=3 SV=1: HSP70: HSP70 [Gemmataceae bacterium]|nr:Heat shock protein 70 OS=Planctomyces limnophilus (strain ATCC 43296 / DSM 3776 / IFAM 1008 / 290) GN=Plim_3585 PE=3 SV=1: HSP70: HSP70 [Gemmataceae bacterium]VTT97418.1 Heat shock protein 70 OS=Planctomyces limnophilus (strain ATCC 43296 / DSM 3776 / IFAM 1008 / 290) GN=Plim_3585 PE=3 SV=1: HSP70: HSP70 [Gemmataceae bacterium]